MFVSIEEEGQHLKYLLKSNGLPHAEHNSHERKKLHLAAVLANNFTHHLLYKVAQMSENLQVPLDIFKNLAQQSLIPSSTQEYYDGQTGPARRDDITTLKNHVELINDPELKVLYEAFNQSIKKTYGTEL